MTTTVHVSSNGKTYFLHSRQINLNGVTTLTYFFSKKEPNISTVIPKGKTIVECPNGFPVLKATKI